MGIKKLFKKWGMTSLKIKAPFVEAEYKPDSSDNRTKNRNKLFQLGYLYGQYCVTENEERDALCSQLKSFWNEAIDNPPSQAVPRKLRKVQDPSIVGELASFLKEALKDCDIAETDANLCLLAFMLFCQPLAHGNSATADLVINYSQAAPITEEERQQLRNDCVATDLGTKENAIIFFKKWTSKIEERL